MCIRDRRYISLMTLNGKEYTKNYLTHQDLMNGATISFKMDVKPNQQRGTKAVSYTHLDVYKRQLILHANAGDD